MKLCSPVAQQRSMTSGYMRPRANRNKPALYVVYVFHWTSAGSTETGQISPGVVEGESERRRSCITVFFLWTTGLLFFRHAVSQHVARIRCFPKRQHTLLRKSSPSTSRRKIEFTAIWKRDKGKNTRLEVVKSILLYFVPIVQSHSHFSRTLVSVILLSKGLSGGWNEAEKVLQQRREVVSKV